MCNVCKYVLLHCEPIWLKFEMLKNYATDGINTEATFYPEKFVGPMRIAEIKFTRTEPLYLDIHSSLFKALLYSFTEVSYMI